MTICDAINCSKYPVHTCSGCNKNLCSDHQDIGDHKCRSCQYCSKTATVYHDGCNKYVCDYYGCEKHIRACHQDNNSGGLFSSCSLCVNGRIITGYNASKPCYLCYGTCSY